MPARDASGDADLTVGDPVGDGLPVATVGVTVAVKVGDAAPVGDGAPVATVGVTDTEKVEFCAVDSREDNSTRRRRRAAIAQGLTLALGDDSKLSRTASGA